MYISYIISFYTVINIFLGLYKRNKKLSSTNRVKNRVTAVVPALIRNEEAVIERTCERISKVKGVNNIVVPWNGLSPIDKNLFMRMRHKYKNLTILEVKDSKSKAENLNYAINLFLKDTDYFVFFDADSSPYPNSVEEGLKLFNTPDVGFVNIRFTSSMSSKSKLTNFMDYIVSLTIHLNIYQFIFFNKGMRFLIGHDTIIKSKCFEKGAKFRAHNFVEDVDMSVQLCEMGYTSQTTTKILSECDPPPSIREFIKQQIKWSKGLTYVFTDLVLEKKIYLIFSLVSMAFIHPYLNIIMLISDIKLIIALPFILIQTICFLLHGIPICIKNILYGKGVIKQEVTLRN